MASLAPGLAGVVAFPDAAAGDGDGDLPGVAGIHAHRVRRGQFGPAAEPLLPFGPIVEAADQLPALAPLATDEDRAGRHARPDQPWLVGAARRQGPDGVDRRRFGAGVLHGREGRRGELRPCRATVVGAMQLHPEVPKSERRIDGPVAGIAQHRRDRLAQEGRRPRRPARPVAGEAEQPLAAGHMQQIAHLILPRAPGTPRPRRRSLPGRTRPAGPKPTCHL